MQGPLLRLLRLLRLTRMARIMKMLRFMPELMVFIQGLRDACRSVFCAFLLLVLVLYFASVAIVQLAKTNNPAIADHFSTVPETWWFLLIATVLPDMWDTVEFVGLQSWYMALVLVAFMMMAAMVVLNMLVGVLVEVVAGVMSKEGDRMAACLVAANLSELFTGTCVIEV